MADDERARIAQVKVKEDLNSEPERDYATK